MSEYKPIEGDDHVVAIEENIRAYSKPDRMLTVGEIAASFVTQLLNTNPKWRDGVRCKFLRLGSNNWVSGVMKIKVKVTLEFRPDNPGVTPLLDSQDND